MRGLLNFAVDAVTLGVLIVMLKNALDTRDDEKGEQVTFTLVVMVINMVLRGIF